MEPGHMWIRAAAPMRRAFRIVPCAVMVFTVWALGAPPSTLADEVRVKGTTLRGTVKAIRADGIEFETVYGTGTLRISADDIESLVTDERFYVLHGKEQESAGRILGLEDGMLLVGESPEDAVRIDMTTIQSGLTEESAEETIAGMLHRRWRHWKGDFDLGMHLRKATTEESGFATALRLERRRRPTRVLLTASYLRSTKKDTDGRETTLDNEAKGSIKGEYDIAGPAFALASFSGEYDEVEQMSFRGVSTLGPGYRFYETATGFLQGEVGGAHVYERFFGGDTNGFFSVRLGGEAGQDLPYRARLNARAEYLPAVNDLTGDYLLRVETSLSVPLVSFISFKLTVAEQYDSTPAENTDRNELKTTMGLSAGF